MINVAAITSGISVPSRRFRVDQYKGELAKSGISVKEYCPLINSQARLPGGLGTIRARYVLPVTVMQMLMNAILRVPGVIGSYKADVTWLERSFLPGFDWLALSLARPLVVDVDDAIWLYNGVTAAALKRVLRSTDMVFAGNEFIANWCSDYCNNIRIIPTAIDCNRFKPLVKEKNDRIFTVGWTGTSGNFQFLKMIEPALARFLRSFPEARLLVVADAMPSLGTLPANQFDFVKWTPENEAYAVQKMDAGIMPLLDSDLARGKCSFKMLQYMACGIPVIVSPIGMNNELLNQGEVGFSAVTADEWYEKLEFLIRNREKAEARGMCGRLVVLNAYSLESVAAKLANGFEALVK